MAATVYVAQTLCREPPFLMIDLWHFDAATTGLVISAWPLGAIIGAPLSGLAMRRWHSGAVTTGGLVLLGADMVCIAWVADGTSANDAAWRLALCGVGFGLFVSPNVHLMVRSPPLRRAGAAGGMIGTARLAGQATGAAMLAAICNETVLQRRAGCWRCGWRWCSSPPLRC